MLLINNNTNKIPMRMRIGLGCLGLVDYLGWINCWQVEMCGVCVCVLNDLTAVAYVADIYAC